MSKWVNQFRSKVKKMLPHSRKMILDVTYDIKDTLGEGIFSVVKKAVNKKTGELVAIKIYDKSRLTCYDKECTITEVELLRSLKHPNIITIKDCIDTRSRLYLIEEFMSGGDLLEVIRKRKVFPEKDARKIFAQILSAIAFLHSNGVVHRDIKADNMLVTGDSDENLIVKIGDFGFAKRSGSGILHTPCGSPVYTAPEIVREDSYDKSVDMWSAGVLLYILLCGYPPFYHRDPSKLFETIEKAVFDFPKEQWGTISESAKGLVSLMLKSNPAERITAQQALEHPWIVNASPPATPSSPSTPDHHETTSLGSKPEPSPPNTTTASAAGPVMDRKTFKARTNKAIEQGTHFTLGAPTSSPLWVRRHTDTRSHHEKSNSPKRENTTTTKTTYDQEKCKRTESEKFEKRVGSEKYEKRVGSEKYEKRTESEKFEKRMESEKHEKRRDSQCEKSESDKTDKTDKADRTGSSYKGESESERITTRRDVGVDTEATGSEASSFGLPDETFSLYRSDSGASEGDGSFNLYEQVGSI